MEVSKCLGCMEEYQGYPCPQCGFDPGKVAGTEYALPMESILAGKFLIGKVLGQGGFGITYIGWDLALERKVAIKEYYPSGQVSRSPGTRMLTWYTGESARNAHQDGMQAFLKEARKMSRLDDIPGVVRVRDLFQENNTAYIVMDFVEGRTLKSLLQEKGPMTWEQAKTIFGPVLQAMEQVHEAGVIHRDLSPDNLMITKGSRVKILDLGAAKDLNINAGASSMQVAKGGFSPFEQYTQRGGSGPWTDVYAMAATIYHTLTGKVPPVATDRLYEDTLSWNHPNLCSLPAPALEVLKKAMELLPKNRLQSMAELAEGLFAQDTVPRPEPPKPEPPRPEPPRPEPPRPEPPRPEPPKPEPPKPEPPKPGAGGIMQKILERGSPALTDTINAGAYHTIGLKSDGSVVAVGDNVYNKCNVGSWWDIVSVSGGVDHTVGLKSNGTVVAVGNNYYGQCNVGSWRNIVSLSAGDWHTVGLKSDGTVGAVGNNYNGQCNVGSWTDIVSVSTGDSHTVGLKSDGTVVAVGDNGCGQCNVGIWRDIVAVSAGPYRTVGLRSDGTVSAVGNNDDDRSNVCSWRGIVSVSVGDRHTVGLKSDGTVVAVGSNRYGQCDVDNWTGIIAISAGGRHTIGLKSDGTVVVVGDNGFGQCDVSDWKDIKVK